MGKKENKFSLKAALVMSSMTAVCLAGVVTPILGNIQMSYESISPSIVNLVSTLPALMSILAMIIGGKLSSVISKKKILFIGFILFTFGGMASALMENIYLLILMRAITGIGAGMATPVVGSIISDNFNDNERETLMGRANAYDSFVSVLFAIFAGILGATNWRLAFLLYAIGIIGIVMQIAFIPSAKSDKQIAKETKIISFDKKIISKVFGVALMSFILGLLGNAFMVGVSRFVLEEKIGNSSSTGMAIALMGVLSLLTSIFYGKLSKIVKKYMMTFVYLANAITFLLLAFPQSIGLVVLSGAFLGISIGAMMPFFMSKAAYIAPVSSRTLVIGIIMGCLQLGQFFGGFLQDLVAIIFKTGEIRFMFTFVGVSFSILTIILFIIAFFSSENKITENIK